MKVKVLRIFRDKNTKVLYPVGKELEFEDEDRVQDLTLRGLVQVVTEKKVENKETISLFGQELEKKAVVEAFKTIGEKATMDMKGDTLIANAAALDEEKTKALKIALGIEA